MPRPQPEQHPPPVQRLRVRYAKRGRARFTSHRDFGRAFERALRRAGVPMAYSSGFSPHPRISYANAAPTGAASEAEYLEIGLVEARDPEEVRRALDAALPPGLDVVEVTEAGAGALADQLTGSRWTADLVGVEAADLEAAVRAFLDQTEVPVERMTKNGLRAFDARGAVVALSCRTGATGHGAGPRRTPGPAGRRAGRTRPGVASLRTHRAPGADPTHARTAGPGDRKCRIRRAWLETPVTCGILVVVRARHVPSRDERWTRILFTATSRPASVTAT